MPLSAADRLIVALDCPNAKIARYTVGLLEPISIFKVGYWLMFDPDFHALVQDIKKRGKQLFLDAKLNDIPETVSHGVQSAVRLGADFITVHGNQAILDAAMEGKGSDPIKIMAVTALTSNSYSESRDTFHANMVSAMIANCDGLIMSAMDLNDRMVALVPDASLKTFVGNKLIATPGIRRPTESTDDHGRTSTPGNAIANGADYLIVGRHIVNASDPLATANQFIADIEAATTQP